MKWAIARFLMALVLAFQFQITMWIWPQQATPAYATQETATVTLTYRVIVAIGPPSLFTLTDLGFISVGANWTAGDNATYHMMRGSRTSYPTLITEGELVFYDTGTSCNISGVPLDTITMYASLWAFQADNATYSPIYVTASIGGEGMEELADSVTSLSSSLNGSFSGLNVSLNTFNSILSDWLPQIIAGVIVLALLIFALWKRESWLYLIAGLAVISYGITYISTDWRIAMLLVILGMGCFGKMFFDYQKRKGRA